MPCSPHSVARCSWSLGVASLLLLALFGCGSSKPEPTQTGSRLAEAGSAANQGKPPASAVNVLPTFPQPADEPQRTMQQERTLDALFEQAGSKPFEEAPMILATDNSALPKIDEERVAAAGIRKIAGKHLTLYTDLPESPAIEELPQVFDAAISQWAEYFDIDAATAASWQQVGYLMQDKTRFVTAGLLPDDLPSFLHGYQRGSELWLYEQPSEYYRRHLLLHEGTHGFMKRFLGGAGPPWYMEGTAELLGTHRWQNERLELRWFPEDKELTSFWGRIKVVQDEVRAGSGRDIVNILRFDKTAHLQVEPYAWCWAAAVFFDSHPAYRERFRELRKFAPDDTLTFSQRFYDSLQDDWPSVARQWHVFIANLDYGYDVAREAIDPKPAVDLRPPVRPSRSQPIAAGNRPAIDLKRVRSTSSKPAVAINWRISRRSGGASRTALRSVITRDYRWASCWEQSSTSRLRMAEPCRWFRQTRSGWVASFRSKRAAHCICELTTRQQNSKTTRVHSIYELPSSLRASCRPSLTNLYRTPTMQDLNASKPAISEINESHRRRRS